MRRAGACAHRQRRLELNHAGIGGYDSAMAAEWVRFALAPPRQINRIEPPRHDAGHARNARDALAPRDGNNAEIAETAEDAEISDGQTEEVARATTTLNDCRAKDAKITI